MKRTQVINLAAGWNAVFLEVEPLDTAPAKVFAGQPVDIAAAYFPQEAPTQFVTNPGTQLFKGLGWGVWYSADRPDAFLKTLNAIYGQQAYLIHTTAAFQWRVEGLVSMANVNWQPNSYNLTGFSMRAQGTPTFAEFFAASPAHRGKPVYRLTDGVWRKVINPAGESMKSGEAFWVFCEGQSDYQGPFTVETSPRSGILILDSSGALVIRNRTDHPVTPTMEHVTVDQKPVPLSIRVRVLGQSEDAVKSTTAVKPASGWTQAMPPMEAAAALSVPFEVRRREMSAWQQCSLLKISTDMGTELWVPVLAVRKDLQKQ
jgi:hypothetical protein